jgi:Zn-dependent peptidase ImmA (M78 family)
VRRGFKAEAERLSSSVRSAMALKDTDPLDSFKLASHVGAEVRRADELTTLDKLQELEAIQPGAFSACTFRIGTRHVIVYSPLSTLGRTQSDIAHEVAHLLLEHQLQTLQQIGGLTFYSCDSEEEQEANWLAGCLLLPRPLLVRAARAGLDAAAIADRFAVSEQMANYRLRATGVLIQLRSAGKKRT